MGPECEIEIAITPEARIIAEDDTHAVVAVRIEKQWLARNIHFLAALADRATVPAVAPIVSGLAFFSGLTALDLALDGFANEVGPLLFLVQ